MTQIGAMEEGGARGLLRRRPLGGSGAQPQVRGGVLGLPGHALADGLADAGRRQRPAEG